MAAGAHHPTHGRGQESSESCFRYTMQPYPRASATLFYPTEMPFASSSLGKRGSQICFMKVKCSVLSNSLPELSSACPFQRYQNQRCMGVTLTQHVSARRQVEELQPSYTQSLDCMRDVYMSR